MSAEHADQTDTHTSVADEMQWWRDRNARIAAEPSVIDRLVDSPYAAVRLVGVVAAVSIGLAMDATDTIQELFK